MSDPSSAPVARWLVIACLLAMYIVWGTTYFAAKVGLEEADPFFLLGTRFLVAGGLLFAYLVITGHPLPTARQWRNASLLGFLLLAVGVCSVVTSEQWLSSGSVVALISVLPLATAIWSGVFGEWPAAGEWSAIALGTVGTLVMILGRDMQASVLGVGLVLLGVMGWSLGTAVSRRINVPKGAMGFAAELLAGGVIVLIISLVLGESWSLPTTGRVWWAWIYLTILGSLVAFSAYRYLVERVSPTLAATYAYVNPPVALFVGWWLGAETFSVNVLVGCPIVLAAVALHTWVQFRKSDARAPAASSPTLDIPEPASRLTK